MRKSEELTNPESCMMRAYPDEMTFVLLERDKAAPVAIRAWIRERIRLGKNTPDDAQIIEAEACAKYMEAELLEVLIEVRAWMLTGERNSTPAKRGTKCDFASDVERMVDAAIRKAASGKGKFLGGGNG